MKTLIRTLRRGLLGLAAAAACAGSAAAQTPAGLLRSYPEHRTGFRCAFDSAQQAAFARQPGAAGAYRTFMQRVAQEVAQEVARRGPAQLLAAPDVTVPVVFHIIHTGGANNTSDAQVLDALRVINEDFSKTNADTASVIPFFQGRYANVGFQLKLARLDPNGNCTTGITRTYSTDTNIGDDRVKSLVGWDPNKYLNVWVCTNANGAGGYAYLPCTGGAVDGIVIRNGQFGSIGTACGANFCTRSLTHEIGHYFGLPHTWGGSNTPGLLSNCGLDDGIADTPNTIGSSGCNLAFAPCTDPLTGLPELANVQNYMDYASCTRMFTRGQRAVMRAALQLGCRQTLVSPANLLATGTSAGYAAPACAPVVAFETTAPVVCEGSAVSFTDYSYNADLTAPGTAYAWQFPGGVPATSGQRNPTVTYPAAGLYAVTLTVTTAAGGAGTRTRPALVQVLGGSAGLTGPVAESFEDPGFPLNFPAPDLRNWANSSNITSSGARWMRRSAVAGALQPSDGAACLVAFSQILPLATQVGLTSPNINLSAYPATALLQLSFDRAYVLRPTPANELLVVQFSSDCGQSWQTQRSLFPAALNTGGALRVDGFVPTAAADWQPLRVDIPASYFTSHFQVRLLLTTNRGNNFYLDRLAVGLAAPLAARAAAGPAPLRVFPNPLTAETVVEFALPAAGPVALRLTDLLGRAVGPATVAAGRAGWQTLPLRPAGAARPAPGVYLVEVRTAAGRFTSKVVID